MNPQKELLCGLWVNPASEATTNTAEVATHFRPPRFSFLMLTSFTPKVSGLGVHDSRLSGSLKPNRIVALLQGYAPKASLKLKRISRGSEYPHSRVSGPKIHTLNGFRTLKPY